MFWLNAKSWVSYIQRTDMRREDNRTPFSHVHSPKCVGGARGHTGPGQDRNRMSSLNLDFGLYRESLGKYLFEGRPQIYFSANLGRTERALLELHEHDHWVLANASIYGKEQLCLRLAARLKAGQPGGDEIERCLQLTVEFSRLVYEGAALEAERSFLSLTRVATPPGLVLAAGNSPI